MRQPRNERPPTSERPRWPACTAIAALATAGALAAMFWLRSAYQIRTLPERVMEWVLIFISPDTVEQGLSRFGADAKVYALYVAVAGMTIILLGLGAALVRYVRSPWALLAVAPILYLVALGGIMPLTGAGPFAVDLLQDWRLVNAGYAGVALSYAGLLVLGQWLAARSTLTRATSQPAASAVARSTGPAAAGSASRRAALVSLGSAAAAFAATLWLGQRSGAASGSLARVQLTPRPLAEPSPAATGAVGPAPTAASAVVAAPAAAATPTSEPATAAPAVAPASSPTPEPNLPTPQTLAKQLSRDQDGSLTAGARQPGTLSSLITPTENHYHVTKNPIADPVIKPEEWSLALDGEVNNPVQLDYATLRQLPTVEIAKTLECVSNLTDRCELVPFGCELIGTASWKGVRLVDLLELARGLKPGVVAVAMIGEDEFVSAVPPEAALDPNTIVAYEMNGTVLPYEHGYPARVLVPGRYGYKSPKWIRVIRPSVRPVVDWYGQRNWSRDGIVKTMTRIDVPAPAATLPAGPQQIAGIAYASNRGISRVEFSADGGASWTPATFLEPQPGVDAWVRWEGSFDLPTGATVKLVARATDGQGTLQTEMFSLAQPNGASGWNSIEVSGA